MAQNGPEALAATNNHSFSIVLMDINLGNDSPDGIQVMRQMRQQAQCRSTKFFAVTSYALPEDRQRFLEAGFDDYFAKPIDKDKIHSAILKSLEISTFKV
ncbi:MAG: response regulator [Microscillaceae bacterium]|nr:response regulator [Microscillaceae bacterium]